MLKLYLDDGPELSYQYESKFDERRRIEAEAKTKSIDGWLEDHLSRSTTISYRCTTDEFDVPLYLRFEADELKKLMAGPCVVGCFYEREDEQLIHGFHRALWMTVSQSLGAAPSEPAVMVGVEYRLIKADMVFHERGPCFPAVVTCDLGALAGFTTRTHKSGYLHAMLSDSALLVLPADPSRIVRPPARVRSKGRAVKARERRTDTLTQRQQLILDLVRDHSSHRPEGGKAAPREEVLTAFQQGSDLRNPWDSFGKGVQALVAKGLVQEVATHDAHWLLLTDEVSSSSSEKPQPSPQDGLS